jgi:hypothetical protein
MPFPQSGRVKAEAGRGSAGVLSAPIHNPIQSGMIIDDEISTIQPSRLQVGTAVL